MCWRRRAKSLSLWFVIQAALEVTPVPPCLVWWGEEEGSCDLALNFTLDFGEVLFLQALLLRDEFATFEAGPMEGSLPGLLYV